MILIAICITLIYLALIATFIYGFEKVETFSLKDVKSKTKFSVIVPFRNEENHLPALLESVSKLNYPKDLYEIIFVDDESEDGSYQVLDSSRLQRNTPTDISILNNIRKSNSAKKDAISLAIKKAKYDWIVTTDADCILPKFWLDSFDEFVQTTNAEFIAAPVTYSSMQTFLNRFQLLDILSLQGSTIGAFGIHKPILCNGANLAYKKELFISVNGFQGNETIGSGDDIFMLEKAVQQNPQSVRYLKCENAIVTTSAQPNFDALISQRVRWAAKTGSYKNLFAKLVGIIVFLMNGGLLVFVLTTLAGIITLNSLFYILIIKFGIDFLLIYKTADFTNQKEVMSTFFFAFFLYPFFSFYVVIISFFRGYKWKGRDYLK